MQRPRTLELSTSQHRDGAGTKLDNEDSDAEKDHSSTPFSFAKACRCCLPSIKLHTSTEVSFSFIHPHFIYDRVSFVLCMDTIYHPHFYHFTIRFHHGWHVLTLPGVTAHTCPPLSVSHHWGTFIMNPSTFGRICWDSS